MANGVAGLRKATASEDETLNGNINSKSEFQAYRNRSARIIVADDRRLCRECVKLLIESMDPDLDVVESESVEQIGALLGQHPGHIVVLYNLVLSDKEGIDFVGALRKSLGDVPLIVMCDADDDKIMRGVLERGAKAFLPSTTPGPLLVAILRLVLAGGIYVPPNLVVGNSTIATGAQDRIGSDARRERVIAENFQMLTPRQRHVLALLSQGKSNRDIAGSLSMCENTVKAHVKQIMRKLSAENRTQVALMADRLIA